MCIWGDAKVQQWGNSTGHSWRMYGDIYPQWAGAAGATWGVMGIVNHASFLWNTTGFWGHSDWDMLEVGRGLNVQESRSHFALWAALKSPLIIGTPLTSISNDMLAILLNKELLALNQDPVYGAAAMPYKWGINPDGTSNITHPAQYWTVSSTAGIHVLMLNTLSRTTAMSAVFSEIPALKGLPSDACFKVHDMWTGSITSTCNSQVTVRVASHDTAALRITLMDGKKTLVTLSRLGNLY
jgi:alpha-galactosidase